MTTTDRPSSGPVVAASGPNADQDATLAQMVGSDRHRPGRVRYRLIAEQFPIWAVIGHIGASSRLVAISDLFGQLPDTLEDVWVPVALRDEERAQTVIDDVPKQHPFEMRYDRVEPVDWESCSTVLDAQSQIEVLLRSW